MMTLARGLTVTVRVVDPFPHNTVIWALGDFAASARTPCPYRGGCGGGFSLNVLMEIRSHMHISRSSFSRST